MQEADRAESGKIGALAAAAGLVASLPYALLVSNCTESALLSAAGIVISCALFGVVYRYARRNDALDNHLKARIRKDHNLQMFMPDYALAARHNNKADCCRAACWQPLAW